MASRRRPGAQAALRRRHLGRGLTGSSAGERRVHPVAEHGFGQAADAYERGRPDYPEAALDLLATELGLGPESTVVDLAAGTGKLTRQLIPRVGAVVAVEPVAAMRSHLAEAAPAATVLDGTAEEMPVGDAAVDAVLVAQAFHWFDAPAALREVHRVLRPGGGLAMLWNERDDTVPWVAALSEIIQRDRQSPYAFHVDWPQVVADAGGFTPLRVEHVPHEQLLDADGLVDRMVSTSYVAAMPEEEQNHVADRVRAVAADLPARFVLPYVCHVHWCRRV